MAKTKILVANWKMRLDYRSSLNLAKRFTKLKKDGKKIIVCPDFSSLAKVGEIIKPGALELGAQDAAAFPLGAYTGAVSAKSLKELGAKYVILGHSERRQYFAESDEIIQQKISLALEFGLIPILCVGEKKGENQEIVIKKQLFNVLKAVKLKKTDKIIVAYEPIWAIGSGSALDAKSANRILGMIKLLTKNILGLVPLALYGGSVNAQNARSFGQEPYIDGLLVGGASLDAKEFQSLINNF